VDAAGQLLACGGNDAAGFGSVNRKYSEPAPVTAMAGVRVRSVVAGSDHSLALSWDGRVYSWGLNRHGQLGHGDRHYRCSPAPVEGFDSVHGLAAARYRNLAVTQSGAVVFWGYDNIFLMEPKAGSVDTEPSDDSEDSEDLDNSD
jgi:alpha-tubulin suppressor-like RCC1 family protein